MSGFPSFSDAALPSFGDAAIGRLVGQQSLARGFVYAQTGHVQGIEMIADDTLAGTVRGTQSTPYRAVVEFDRIGAPDFWTECTCPVGRDCKHVAAVLIASRRQAASPAAAGPGSSAAEPGWERALGALLPGGHADSSSTERFGGAVLGLRIEAGLADASAPLALRCRPVRPGKAGKWVQQGIGWNELRYDRGRRFDIRQSDLLAQLHETARPADRYGYYGGGDWLDLAESGGLLWSALTDLRDAGVALVPGAKSQGAVGLSGGPAEISLDARTIDGKDDLIVGPRLELAGVVPAARRLGFVGRPAHGVVIETGEGAALEYVLAPLGRPCEPAIQDWLESGRGSVTVPGADRSRFLAEFAPKLQRSVTLGSADDSVTFPEPSPPQIALAVDHGGPAEIALEWSLVYPVGEGASRIDPTAPGHGGGLRDRAAERALWAALLFPDDEWVPRLGLDPDALAPVRHLSGIEAASFCAEVVPLFEEAGVDVTQTGETRDYRRSDEAPDISFTVNEIDDSSDWFDLVVDVSLEEEKIPFVLLFQALARDQANLILPSGIYFSLDRPEFRRLGGLIHEARLLQDRERTNLRINVLQPSLWEDLVECGVVTEQSARWQQRVAAIAELDRPLEVDAPEGLRAELRPYQHEGYAWLRRLWSAGIGGILADDMGLGKTLEGLALICAVFETEAADQAETVSPEPAETGGPFLVVAPTSVVANWASEAARFAPGLRVVAIDRTEKKRGTPLAELADGADIVITSYTLLRIDAEYYEGQQWRGLILDEAQFVKNHQAKSYACIRRLGIGFTIAMTGTPLENSLMDLWSMLSLTAPGMFPSPQKFTEYYRNPIERGDTQEVRRERLAQLRRRIRPVMLRRTKDVVARDLPSKQEQVLEVGLDVKHARIYQTHLQRERQKVLRLIGDLDENRFMILRSLTMLRQLSLKAGLIDDKYADIASAKIDLLAEMLPELAAEGHRALVFSSFTRFLRNIGERLTAEGVSYSYLDGSTRNRAGVIDRFRSGENHVFLISLKAGGFGLNLTEADYCFICDPWWNPAAEAQAVDRTHRIGQTRPVMVYRLVSKDTIEEKVMAMKARKDALFSSIMDADALPAGALNSDDIRGLLDV